MSNDKDNLLPTESDAGFEGPRIDLQAVYGDADNSVVVLGVGNILLSDEGLGVHALRELREEYRFNPAVNCIDGGTMGMELLTYMRGMKKLLLIDAVKGGGAPGTVYEFTHRDMGAYLSGHISVHEVGMQDILKIRALQEDPLEDAVVIGVEPLSLEVGFALTEPVAAALAEVKERALRVLSSWQIEWEKR